MSLWGALCPELSSVVSFFFAKAMTCQHLSEDIQIT